jgi:predicted outer membrane protein
MTAPRIAGFSLLLALSACGHHDSSPAPGTTSPGLKLAPALASAEVERLRAEPVATEGGAQDARQSGPPAPNPAAHGERGPALSLNDDQILQIVHQAHLGQVQQAYIAHAKSKDGRVKKLAAAMIRDGAQAENRGDALAKRAGLRPESSPVSEALQNDESSVTLALNATSSKEFDRSYLDTQVREHQTVLDVLTAHLLPSSTNPELRAYLQGIEASTNAQLEHARALQQELAK